MTINCTQVGAPARAGFFEETRVTTYEIGKAFENALSLKNAAFSYIIAEKLAWRILKTVLAIFHQSRQFGKDFVETPLALSFCIAGIVSLRGLQSPFKLYAKQRSLNEKLKAIVGEHLDVPIEKCSTLYQRCYVKEELARDKNVPSKVCLKEEDVSPLELSNQEVTMKLAKSTITNREL